jgi:hypothetical protein
MMMWREIVIPVQHSTQGINDGKLRPELFHLSQQVLMDVIFKY